ncbi:MAG: NADP-dependent malic enzyme, partial [Candidatus Thiodiazotropha sp. (ex Codakia orbicularis)]|nr:NADP-dependent malic enzyme [Candidatus Thiodiazotropha sp. (ex Codakia orbicularis)]
MPHELRQAALDYHRSPKPGKLEIKATKPMANQRDLALAYSPGVAAACQEIEKDPNKAADYTARGNLVAVVSNGTAVLGLGSIGSLASKPVMEGKAVLFKQFADIDVFDIEIDEQDPQQFIDTVARLEPSFGGINLEDIKAPDCFIIEKALKERMNIPVFHDDQHGTAIVVCAAIFNGLKVVGKAIDEVRLVTAGAGAAALACLDLLIEMGMKQENIIVTDISGVIYEGRREEMDPYKGNYAAATPHRTLEQALDGADIFLGLSAGGVLKPEWLPKMASDPLILALANPYPEVMPEEAKAVRPDAILATGRTDYPNQVNNVICFPFLFRGALDVGATEINREMKLACIRAIAEMAQVEPSDVVRSAYGGQQLHFGPEYLIPKPFDPQLMESVPYAV